VGVIVPGGFSRRSVHIGMVSRAVAPMMAISPPPAAHVAQGVNISP
jgi:hypothetical protein